MLRGYKTHLSKQYRQTLPHTIRKSPSGSPSSSVCSYRHSLVWQLTVPNIRMKSRFIRSWNWFMSYIMFEFSISKFSRSVMKRWSYNHISVKIIIKFYNQYKYILELIMHMKINIKRSDLLPFWSRGFLVQLVLSFNSLHYERKI